MEWRTGWCKRSTKPINRLEDQNNDSDKTIMSKTQSKSTTALTPHTPTEEEAQFGRGIDATLACDSHTK